MRVTWSRTSTSGFRTTTTRGATTFRFSTTTNPRTTSSTSRANDFASPQCTGPAGVSGVACATYLYGPQVFPNSFPRGAVRVSIGGTFSGAGLNAIQHCVTNYGYPNAVNPGTFTNPNTVPAGRPRCRSLQPDGHRKAAVHEELRLDRVPARLRLYVLQRVESGRTPTADVDCDFRRAWRSRTTSSTRTPAASARTSRIRSTSRTS